MLTVRLDGQHFVNSAQTLARYVPGSAGEGVVWAVRNEEQEVSIAAIAMAKIPKKESKLRGMVKYQLSARITLNSASDAQGPLA